MPSQRVRSIVAGTGATVESVDSPPPPYRRVVTVARKWSLDSWRGGLGGSAAFDEYTDTAVHLAIARKTVPALDPNWNCLERYERGRTALLHYTNMHTQPWVSTRNPLGYLWVRDLIEAVETGSIPRDYIAEHVQQQWVRPSLLHQIDEKLEDPLLLPAEARALDRGFVAPYRALLRARAPWRHPLMFLRAATRHLYRKTPLHRVEQQVRRHFAT